MLAVMRGGRISRGFYIFIEVMLSDSSNFHHKPLMKSERDGELEVIRLTYCVSVQSLATINPGGTLEQPGKSRGCIHGFVHELGQRDEIARLAMRRAISTVFLLPVTWRVT
jgi:hypothetical protein